MFEFITLCLLTVLIGAAIGVGLFNLVLFTSEKISYKWINRNVRRQGHYNWTSLFNRGKK